MKDIRAIELNSVAGQQCWLNLNSSPLHLFLGRRAKPTVITYRFVRNENRFLYLEVFDIIPAAIPRDAAATDTLHSKINSYYVIFEVIFRRYSYS